MRGLVLLLGALASLGSGCATGGIAAAPTPPSRWRLVHHETFDAPFAEPAEWTEDTYGDASPWHVDAFDDDGAFFVERGGATFAEGLRAFRSFRKSFRYGEAGWVGVELYGRDSDRDGVPETGGRFRATGGKAQLTSTRHYDAAILTSAEPLPPRYRVEVTVSNIRFGGAGGGSWTRDGKTNGYDGDEVADPWRFDDSTPKPHPATTENGLYFLCITDYPRPAPHNNVFIHHHRKVVMDTDNNRDGGASWSKVWDPVKRAAVEDGDHYFAMLFLEPDDHGKRWTGNGLVSWTPNGWSTDLTFADKYLEAEPYVVSIERDGDRYTLSARGRFFHGGATTYVASRGFREAPPTWHYNVTAAEYDAETHERVKSHRADAAQSWPLGSSYPDHFLLGDPHINFYEGTADFDDLKLYVPEP
jgi:hypothetical protein